MTSKSTGFSLFNSKHSNDRRSLQSLLNKNNDNKSRIKKSPKKYTNYSNRSSSNTVRNFRSKFDTIKSTGERKQLIFTKNSNPSPAIKPIIFRNKINDINSNTNMTISKKKKKKKTELDIFKERLKKIEGNDSWDLYEDSTISRFVLGSSVIEFKNLSIEQYKFYQKVIQSTNYELDKINRKKMNEILKCDPNVRYKNNVIDRLWRNPDIPLAAWNHAIVIIEKMDYNLNKFMQEYVYTKNDNEFIINQLRNISKKLRKINLLEKKLGEGKSLNDDQQKSLENKDHYLLKKIIFENKISYPEEDSLSDSE